MGLASAGYAALPDLLAAMRAGPNRGPFVMQGDVSNADNATAQTIEQMALLIKESIDDPLTQSVAQRACDTWGGGSNDPRSVAWSCWWYAKHAIKFVLDEPAVRSIFGTPDTLEFLVSPALMLRSRKMQGDCDDFTMMICALLGCRGLGYEIITVAASPRDPGTFSHVYCRAILPDGSRAPLDASHGKYPGWQVPSGHVSRFQAWDADGNAVTDEGSNNRGGLHGYEARSHGLGACDVGMVDDGEGGCIFDITTGSGDGTTPYVPVGPPSLQPTTCPSGLVLLSGECVIPGTTVAPASAGGVNTTPGAGYSLPGGFANALAAIFGTGSQIANTALKPTVPAGSIAIPTNSLLLYGGLAVVALLAIAMVSKK